MTLPTLRTNAAFRYFTFFYLYAMQGIPAGFALTALANYLIGKGVNSVVVGSFDAMIGIPWVFQFAIGPLIDRYQYSIMGLRKHWIIASELLALATCTSLLLVHDPVRQIPMLAGIFVVHSFFASIQDASVDATAIALVPANQQGKLNAFMRAGLVLGLAVGAAGFSSILHTYGFYYAALCQCLILLVLTIMTFLTKIDAADFYFPVFKRMPPTSLKSASENQAKENPGLKWLFSRLVKGMLQKKSLWSFGLISMVYLCMSVFIRSYSFHLIHTLHWNDNALSVFQGTWGSVITIGVTLGGGYLADRLGAGRLQYVVVFAICAFFIGFDALGYFWSHRQFSLSGLIVYNLAEPMFSIGAIPVLMALCLAKVEGSQFTAYMAAVNLCDVLGAWISGWALTFTSAPVIGFVCGLAIICALLVQRFTRSTGLVSQSDPSHLEDENSDPSALRLDMLGVERPSLKSSR